MVFIYFYLIFYFPLIITFMAILFIFQYFKFNLCLLINLLIFSLPFSLPFSRIIWFSFINFIFSFYVIIKISTIIILISFFFVSFISIFLLSTSISMSLYPIHFHLWVQYDYFFVEYYSKLSLSTNFSLFYYETIIFLTLISITFKAI